MTANAMRLASKGALDLPARETIEILVYMATTPLFGEEASLTLASWDEAACREVCSDPTTPREVLDYFMKNRRPRVMPALLENPAIPESALQEMAQEESAESVQLLLGSERARNSANVLQALSGNPALMPSQSEQIRRELEQLRPPAETGPDEAETLARFVAEHADEIAAEEGKAFELVEEPEPETPAEEPAPAPAPVRPLPTRSQRDDERMSPLQKISKLSVGERVHLAMRGSREERFILIRDGARIVSAAVLESPKVNEQEIEAFASMKNVQESVLRGIASKRKYMKVYAVVRALANNPRCPLDVQLTILKNLLNMDLRALSMNKNVSDTIRKTAAKLFRERTEKRGGG